MSLTRASLRTLLLALAAAAFLAAQSTGVTWKHLSSKSGDFPAPNSGTQQTSATAFDIDKDGVNDFVITERTAAPPVVWYRRGKTGWTRHVVETEPLRPEAGATYFDVDGDGDLDYVVGADARSNMVWWWENPCPDFKPDVPWKRHVIKDSGAPKHHDLMFGDVDADGKEELVFWNQSAQKLWLARIPPNPRTAGAWRLEEIYSYSADSEQVQRGKPAGFKSVNEHEGLAKADIDGDGKLDIVGGGRWFKHMGGSKFVPNIVDASYSFSRAAAGQLKKGGRPEVVLVVGDGEGPLLWYEWVKGTWIPHELAQVDNGHSLAIVDFNNDGNLDIFCAEMRLNSGNPDSKIYIFLGDGSGTFKTTVVDQGYDLHEAKIVDLDGNGTLDILGKAYNWETPRLDVWLNMGGGAEQGFVNLFNGKDLNGWTMGSTNWVVEADGLLALKNREDGKMRNEWYLWTEKTYGDFILELDYKVPTDRANSGVFIRTADKKNPVQTGIEIQVGNANPDRPLSRGAVGGIYDLVAPKVNAHKPGEWNHYRIACQGSKITIVLNGTVTAEADLDQWTEARKNPDGSPNKFKTPLKEFARKGYIGFQDHGSPAWYRNIRIKPLD
jgi:uncharacterized protein (DUF427 family)